VKMLFRGSMGPDAWTGTDSVARGIEDKVQRSTLWRLSPVPDLLAGSSGTSGLRSSGRLQKRTRRRQKNC